jgi:hypothetical protein
VGLDLEGIDRLYLTLYQPRLQTGGGVVGLSKDHRGAQAAVGSFADGQAKLGVGPSQVADER